MLAGFRSFAKSPFAVVLFALLIISFAVFGISDVFRHPPGKWVIAAGERRMTPVEFKNRFEEYRKQAQQQGQTITADQAVEHGLDRRMLSELALQESLAELVRKVGIRPSDKLVADVLHQQMASLPPGRRPFDPVTGKFDRQAYEGLLREVNLTPERYEASLRDAIGQGQMSSSIAGGVRAPRIYSALQAAYGMEARDLTVFAINPAGIAPPPQPTDAQLQTFMKQNAEALTRPETRVLSVARFSAKALEPSTTVAEADVLKAFDAKKRTLSAPETRSFVQIVAPDAKAAAVISQRLAKGEQPAAVAAAYGKTPVNIDAKAKTALPDRKVADAVFSLTTGQVSPPINGDLGVSVVKLLKILPPVVPSLEAQRPAIEAELKAQAAQAKAYEQTQTYQDAHDGGANLLDAAAKAKALVLTTPPIAAQGVDQTGRPVPGLTPDVLKTAFELSTGGESELIEAGKGEYYAVRVERVIPSAIPPLAEIKPILVQQWMRQKMLEAMKAKADELAARVKKGESMEAVATSVGSKSLNVPNISRQNVRQFQGLGRDLLVAAFNAKPGEIFISRGPQGGYVVAKVTALRPGAMGDVARLTEMGKVEVSRGLARDMGDAAMAAAKTQLKTETNLDLARQAIGVDTTAAPKDGKGAGKDKGE